MYIGKILDPIHGTIKTTEIEKWIINQKLFNRLKKIKQNTLLNYVFPGANHTRFEHSIGVMHLAGKIFKETNDNVTAARLKSEKYTLKHNFLSVIELVDQNSLNLDVVKQEVRLAALLHDVGHGPTSHKFDDFTINGAQLIEILKTENSFDEYLDRFDFFLSKTNSNGVSGLDRKIEHELVSVVFIIRLIKLLKSETKFNSESKKIIQLISIDNIIKMIEPKFDPNYEIKFGKYIVTDYFNSIISSFPIDADRMDYLYRDSFFSGVKYGFYDLTRILNSLVPVNYDNRITLGIKSSGLDSVIRFIQSRNHLYNQVYFHKTNTSTNTMLDFVFRHLTEQSVMEEITDFEKYEDFYWKNSDEYFFNVTLKKILEKDGCKVCEEGCIENSVLDELMERRLWKRVYEKKLIIDNPRKFKYLKFNNKKLEKIKSELEKDEIFINVHYCGNEGLKGWEKSKIVILDKENDYTPTKNWKKFNPELQFLNKTNVFITRIYLRKIFKDAKAYEAEKAIVISKFEEAGLI